MYYKDYSIEKYASGGIFKDKLLGSSPNYDGILKLLKQFFYSPNIFLTEDEIGGSYYVINNAKGKINDYYVFFSKGRYRFFEKDKVEYDERIKEQREKSEIISKQSKLKNKKFVDTMADFLLDNKIKGIPTTYGFNINRTPDYKERLHEIEDKLEKLGVKYQLDFSNQWNVMFKLNKKDVLSENKTIDEEKEIETSVDIETIIKALQTSLKYAGANTRLRIEEQISALRIAQKYEKPKREMADGGMMAKGGKFKEYKPKFLKEGYDYGKKAYHNGINAPFYDTEFNSFLKENVYPKKDNKIVIDYLNSWNKGWNDENYKNTDWLVKEND